MAHEQFRALMSAVDDLRRTYELGFENIDRRFHELDARINRRFDSLEARCERLSRRIERAGRLRSSRR